MGFFSNLNEGAIYGGSDYDSLINDSRVTPSNEYLEFDEASLIAVAESEENYNSLVKYIGVTEASYFAQTGREMVYTESVFGSIFTKIKEFLKKVWEKIKALFKRFIMLFDKYSKDDKSFIKKYEKAVRRASGEEIEFKGYPFSEATLQKFDIKNDTFSVAGKTITEWFAACNNGIKGALDQTGALDAIDKFREDSEDTFDTLRGRLLNKNESISSGDFSKELFEATHGSSSKESLDTKDKSAENALAIISGTKAANKEAKKNYETTDKLINKGWIKAIEQVEKNALNMKNTKLGDGSDLDSSNVIATEEMPGDTDDSKNKNKSDISHFASALLNYLHTASGLVTQVNGALLTAYKDKNRQARAICAKYIVKGKTQGAIGESASYSGSFLSNIQFK